MATNDFIGFASNGNANVMSQADYAAAVEQGVGVQPGMASSALANKVWRQAANMAAVIGQLIKNHGIDALDNGDLVTLYNALLSATASTTLAGWMSAADKAALDNIPFTYLPLTGGELTGPITVNGESIATIKTGTWTPELSGSNTSGDITYAQRAGYYMVVGKLCFLKLSFDYTLNTAPTGGVVITGVPFVAARSNTYGGTGVFLAIANGLRKIFGGEVNTTSTQIGLWAVNSDTPYLKDVAVWGSSPSDVSGYKVYGNGVLMISGIYPIE